MIHLRIKQSTSSTEQVSGAIIEKLYNTTKDILDYKAEHPNDSDDYSVELEGTLNADITYQDYIDYLAPTTGTKKFPNLYITATETAIKFADPNMLNALLNKGIGSNGAITQTQANAVGSFSQQEFKDNTSIISFNELPRFTNVHVIPNQCFYGCTNLNSIDLSNITSIGNSAFHGCTDISSINLSNITSIDDNAFQECTNLSSVVGLNNLSLGERVFKMCTSLAQIDLGQISSIDSGCFAYCTGLTSISSQYVTTLNGDTFSNCNHLQTVDFPNLISFDRGEFESCSSLTTITVSNNLSSVPESTFANCENLTTINGATNITSVGDRAFLNCKNLVKTFDLSNTITLPKDAFKNCAKCTFLNIENVSNFSESCLVGCNGITSLTFKNGVTVGLWPFEDNKQLTSITFLGSGSASHGAFRGCSNLTSVTFGGDVALGASCFSRCSSLQSIDLSNISEQSLFYAWSGYTGSQFSQCSSLASVTFNPNITRIPNDMFSYCGQSGLTLTIPAGVTDIGAGCFYATNAHLTVLATTPPTVHDDNTLSYVADIKVPYGCKSTYDAAPYWSAKASVIYELPQS